MPAWHITLHLYARQYHVYRCGESVAQVYPLTLGELQGFKYKPAEESVITNEFFTASFFCGA